MCKLDLSVKICHTYNEGSCEIVIFDIFFACTKSGDGVVKDKKNDL